MLIPYELEKKIKENERGRRKRNGIDQYFCDDCNKWREGITRQFGRGDENGWEVNCEVCDNLLDED